MKRVEALIRTHKLDAVKASLTEHGVTGMTISEVRGFGRQKGHSERYRGAEYKVDFVPKIKIDVVIPDQDLDKVVDLIATAAATGEVGDGKIFVSSLENVIRIRTRESGENAI
jgi:nitrogen regulatory protein P-II 1